MLFVSESARVVDAYDFTWAARSRFAPAALARGTTRNLSRTQEGLGSRGDGQSLCRGDAPTPVRERGVLGYSIWAAFPSRHRSLHDSEIIRRVHQVVSARHNDRPRVDVLKL